MNAKLMRILARWRTAYHRRRFYKRDKWMIKAHGLPHLTKEEVRQANEAWPFVRVTEKDLIWLRVYKQQFGFDPFFVSDYQLEFILRRTNPYNQVISLENKALYDVYFPQIPFPKSYLKCINGVLWADNHIIGRGGYIGSGYLLERGILSFVIKPTVETGCGKGVRLINLAAEDDKRAFLSGLLDSFGENFIVQEIIKQHPDVMRLNPASVNSCRITSVFINGCFSYSSIIKFGKQNSNIDNWQSGYLGGIEENGNLKGVAYDSQLNKTTSANGVDLSKVRLPMFGEMIAKIKDWHTCYFRQVGIIGWDVLIDSTNNVRVIEMNLASPGVVGEQFCSGPFLKNHREDIITLLK